jgi:hypothetical protein
MTDEQVLAELLAEGTSALEQLLAALASEPRQYQEYTELERIRGLPTVGTKSWNRSIG